LLNLLLLQRLAESTVFVLLQRLAESAAFVALAESAAFEADC
jgi:hypothetical protein